MLGGQEGDITDRSVTDTLLLVCVYTNICTLYTHTFTCIYVHLLFSSRLPYRVKMAKGDPKKPKGKMSAYAFFVQTCREEHKKKNPEVPVNFAEFSKKCSERWKVP